MPALSLTTEQRRNLRADAHHLDPVVMVGADGLTPAIVKEADRALRAHGLIKVRIFAEARGDREGVLARLCDELSAAPVQHIGKLLVLWRPRPEAEKPAQPDRKPGPHVVKIVKFSKSGNHRATVSKVKVLGNERVTAGGLVKRKDTRRAAGNVSPKRRAGD
jgi:putative YhbY family RNA-binding protein